MQNIEYSLIKIYFELLKLMEIISLDPEETINTNNNNKNLVNNHLLGTYSNFFNKREAYDLNQNILIEIEIIHYDKAFRANNIEKSKI